ncbi:MAG: Mth938-like domain-containing protein [Rhodospirillales bacterium]|nr:Mth938-like domain-containing protein [Rhodospirillales bacterium]
MAIDVSARKIVAAYGDGGFRVGNERFSGSIILLPDLVAPWTVRAAAELSLASFSVVLAAAPLPEILLLGCGRRMAPITPPLRQELRAAGLALEAMDTGAACRTYNVLLAEARRVAAALIAVD